GRPRGADGLEAAALAGGAGLRPGGLGAGGSLVGRGRRFPAADQGVVNASSGGQRSALTALRMVRACGGASSLGWQGGVFPAADWGVRRCLVRRPTLCVDRPTDGPLMVRGTSSLGWQGGAFPAADWGVRRCLVRRPTLCVDRPTDGACLWRCGV